ncbi:Transmembrane and coiled-coil domains protein 1 [Aphelenchoides fujianensis]|nr:Transmembrane and coiled-coil domains protein 1 [Aphelenchoides fujianensis]
MPRNTLSPKRPKHLDVNERVSAHSSDDAGESGSIPLEGAFVPSASFVDQRSRLERKIEKIREKITKNSIAREADIEQYLNVMNNADAETAQMARLKQNFERKNKKYSQEADALQKKLEDYEQRLVELDNGVDLSRSHHKHLLQNVGHGITKTGVNLKGMAGSVINAPLTIAHGGVFGSADNIANVSQDEKSGSGVGQSVFYDEHEEQAANKDKEEPPTRSEAEDPMLKTIPEVERVAQSDSERNDQLRKLQEEVSVLKQRNGNLQRAVESLKRETDEFKTQRSELMDARFKIQQLEHTLNETMELHQSEVKQLKTDLNLIGTRMDYQYNDRFKKIEESVESAQNRMYRMETNWHENSEKLLGKGQNMWNAVLLSCCNIIVEVLKIFLFAIAVVLDFVKPFTGTRKRAGIVVSLAVSFFLFWKFGGFEVLCRPLRTLRFPRLPKSR